MHTSHLAPAFEVPGPFATVLADVSVDTAGDGEHGDEPRVGATCQRLEDQGASPLAVSAVRERLSELVSRAAPVARLVLATAEGVVHDELAGVRVDEPMTSWAPLPDLAAWVELRDSAVTFVLALVEHEGGDVALYDSDVPDALEAVAGGASRHVDPVPAGGWSTLRYQHVTENVWARNAEAVVEEVIGHVRAGRDLVLLTGDPRSVGLVRDGLQGSTARVVELATGAHPDDGGDETLEQAIREALMSEVVRRRLADARELADRLRRDHAVASGVTDVADAFARGQVETLLLDRRAAAAQTLSLADHPGLGLGALRAREPLRADLALVAAAVLTDAQVAVRPRAALGGSPVAALLRRDQDTRDVD